MCPHLKVEVIRSKLNEGLVEQYKASRSSPPCPDLTLDANKMQEFGSRARPRKVRVSMKQSECIPVAETVSSYLQAGGGGAPYAAY